MGKVQNGNYIVIQSFMVNELHLKGNELLIYAIIYGFTQDREHQFNGGLQYLMEWTNSTKAGVYKAIKRLVEKGLIEKIDNTINGVNFVNYRITLFTKGVNFVYSEGVNFVNPNNKPINNKEIYKEEWNKIKGVPHILNVEGIRKKALDCRIKEYGEKKVIEAIQNVDKSAFLKGENERKWRATFDWLMKPSNFVKVLEGNYNGAANSGRLQRKPSFDIKDIQKRAKLNEDYDI